MGIDTLASLPFSCETGAERAIRVESTIDYYRRIESERPTWDDISGSLHEITFSLLFEELDKQGMVKDNMVALFLGSHDGHGPKFFRGFVDDKGYESVKILSLEIAER